VQLAAKSGTAGLYTIWRPNKGMPENQKSFADIERVFKGQSRTPLTPVQKSPAKEDPLPSKPSEREKRNQKKSDEKLPLLIKKDITKKKLTSKEVIDFSNLTMRDFIYYSPADGQRP
jgi:hypothetical protein